jgi:hypothetical protein
VLNQRRQNLDPLHNWTLVNVLGGVALANFLIFVAITLFIGGDAINGQITGGHYYLSDHGKLTEVSQPIYIYSYIHAASTIILMLSAVLLSLWKTYIRRKP